MNRNTYARSEASSLATLSKTRVNHKAELSARANTIISPIRTVAVAGAASTGKYLQFSDPLSSGGWLSVLMINSFWTQTLATRITRTRWMKILRLSTNAPHPAKAQPLPVRDTRAIEILRLSTNDLFTKVRKKGHPFRSVPLRSALFAVMMVRRGGG